MAEYALLGIGIEDGDNNGSDLASQSWYWEGLDKEEANRILMAKTHGHFLVRDSSVSGDYTLVVRRRDKIRNIRILRGEDGGFGVAENRCDFTEVSDLILYLMNHPRILRAHFNNVELLYPVSKPESMIDILTHNLLKRLVLRNKDLMLANEQYSNHIKQRKLTLQTIQQMKTMRTSLNTVMSLFEEQLAALNTELSGDLMKPASSEESSSVEMNRSMMHGRIATMKTRIDGVEREERKLSTAALSQLETFHQQKAILSDLQQEVTFLRLRVEERGLVKEYLDLLLKDQKDVDLSHYDPGNWSVVCGRPEAERILEQRDPGTFLVRPGSDGGYALSIACAIDDNVDVRHCKIHMDPHSFQFGFHRDYCIFASLEELVKKHQTISLRFYNVRLDVCLTYPVNYHRNRAPSQ
ncbi:phosphatidylinositol 3-kinase regulatory subunit alpha-like [Babylonia areolata]|uniref:phosphatidylinositol 3-kinase regulatory subunit alpha-like n=1 Tax=Babylonia areolata TaxID=304850 RepID=UPI003FD2B5F5